MQPTAPRRLACPEHASTWYALASRSMDLIHPMKYVYHRDFARRSRSKPRLRRSSLYRRGGVSVIAGPIISSNPLAEEDYPSVTPMGSGGRLPTGGVGCFIGRGARLLA